MAVETLGIRHVHILVADHDRSVSFYRDVFGMEIDFRDGDILFLCSPNRRDDLALHLAVSDEEKARVVSAADTNTSASRSRTEASLMIASPLPSRLGAPWLTRASMHRESPMVTSRTPMVT